MRKNKKTNLKSIVNYDVFLVPKTVKLVEVDESRAGLISSKKATSSVNSEIKKLSLIMTSSRRNRPPHNTHPRKEINRAKLRVPTPCSVGGDKAHKQNSTF